MDIAHTYAKLQGADGTWALKVREKHGSPVRANRLVPGRYILGLFDSLVPCDAALAPTRDRAFAYVLDGPMKTWNWDGQFEDMDPMPPYQNLQKGVAVDTALRLFKMGRNAEALEIVDWCEDQFTVWSDPIHHMDWQHWKTPTALEQYDYYTPIDASMGDMIGAFAAAYRATGDALYLEKARALADNITRNQRADGTIPTYFDSRGGSDWVNCMVYVADRLEYLSGSEP
jgi:maltose/maltodextrin transport system substrate-binding protein